ncbi:hypothetical protein KUCAC02_006583, partial [Chaenocephalus aceratus]
AAPRSSTRWSRRGPSAARRLDNFSIQPGPLRSASKGSEQRPRPWGQKCNAGGRPGPTAKEAEWYHLSEGLDRLLILLQCHVTEPLQRDRARPR